MYIKVYVITKHDVRYSDIINVYKTEKEANECCDYLNYENSEYYNVVEYEVIE